MDRSLNRMRKVSLGELLPTEAIEKIVALVNAGTKTAADFKAVLEPYRDALLAKEVVVEYLAYAIEHMVRDITSIAPEDLVN